METLLNLKEEYTVASYIDQGLYYPNMSYQEVGACWNGLGPEFFPKKMRGLLDACFPVFKDAVIIHDVDYCRGLTEADKVAADTRMLRNMYACIRHQIPWWNLRRRLRYFLAARALYRTCQIAGGCAFERAKMD